VPGAPNIVRIIPGNESFAIVYSNPTVDGGSPIVEVNATCNPGALTATVVYEQTCAAGAECATSIPLPGLTNGVAYTCTVTASNQIGTGVASTGITSTPRDAQRYALESLRTTFGTDANLTSQNYPVFLTASGAPVNSWGTGYYCNWDGVTCDLNGNVITLNMQGLQYFPFDPACTGDSCNSDTAHITGQIPNTIGGLAQLQELNMNSNHLIGTIPPEIGALTNLHTLSLMQNCLRGGLPATMPALTSLQVLRLNFQVADPAQASDSYCTTSGLSGIPDTPEMNALFQQIVGLGGVGAATCNLRNNSFICPIPSNSRSGCGATCA